MSYRRVNEQDRIAINRGRRAGLNQSEIARNLGFHKCTISRELSRNRGRKGYRAPQAHRFSEARQCYRSNPRSIGEEKRQKILELLQLRWSPEQISNRLKREGKFCVSHEWIYQLVIKDRRAGGCLWKCLRRSFRKRRMRHRSLNTRGLLQNFTPIEHRGKCAEQRRRLGHWERDTIIGRRMMDGLLVLVDRRSRYLRIRKLHTRKAKETAKATVKLLRNLPCRTITNDRGHEFWNHRYVTKKLQVPVYFCNPYASHERGTNENRIGLIRQFLPKKTAFEAISHYRIKQIENELNTRPMKCLNWQTPSEVFYGRRVALTD